MVAIPRVGTLLNAPIAAVRTFGTLNVAFAAIGAVGTLWSAKRYAWNKRGNETLATAMQTYIDAIEASKNVQTSCDPVKISEGKHDQYGYAAGPVSTAAEELVQLFKSSQKAQSRAVNKEMEQAKAAGIAALRFIDEAKETFTKEFGKLHVAVNQELVRVASALQFENTKEVIESKDARKIADSLRQEFLDLTEQSIKIKESDRGAAIAVLENKVNDAKAITISFKKKDAPEPLATFTFDRDVQDLVRHFYVPTEIGDAVLEAVDTIRLGKVQTKASLDAFVVTNRVIFAPAVIALSMMALGMATARFLPRA